MYSSIGILNRLAGAINAHDLDAFVALFHADFESIHPAHPARTFRGREQVRKNWSAIFAGIRDLEADVVDAATSAGCVWSEWRWHGKRAADGAPFEMRGVTRLEVRDESILRGWFFMEPLDRAPARVDVAIRDQVGS
jgi:ketosteroid isomerase-like protein